MANEDVTSPGESTSHSNREVKMSDLNHMQTITPEGESGSQQSGEEWARPTLDTRRWGHRGHRPRLVSLNWSGIAHSAPQR